MKRLFVLPVAFLVCIAPAGFAGADAISKGCGDFESIADIPAPVEKNILDIKSSKQRPQDVRLATIYRGEPVSAGAWLLIFVIDGVEKSCFVLHSGSKADGKERPGFNDVRLDRAFHHENSKDGRIELFVPVTKYPFAADEDYGARIIEINIGKDGDPKVVKDRAR